MKNLRPCYFLRTKTHAANVALWVEADAIIRPVTKSPFCQVEMGETAMKDYAMRAVTPILNTAAGQEA
jgi:hypothetical protein